MPVLLFWGLDGYFLWQERLFRALYDHVRMLENGEVDFSMRTHAFRVGWQRSWIGATLSITMVPVLRCSHCGNGGCGTDRQLVRTIPWRVERSAAFATNLTTGVKPWFEIPALLSPMCSLPIGTTND